MDSGTIAAIATGILMVLGFIAVGILTKIKGGINALAESGDVVKALKKALEDSKITASEVDDIIAEINEAKGAWKSVFAGREETPTP